MKWTGMLMEFDLPKIRLHTMQVNLVFPWWMMNRSHTASKRSTNPLLSFFKWTIM
jgi:hypothetical protein